MTKTIEEILKKWSYRGMEDALTALYDSKFAEHMIKEGSPYVKIVLSDKNYAEAIMKINEKGGFVS